MFLYRSLCFLTIWMALYTEVQHNLFILMQKYRFVLPRRNFKPARPDPWKFQTRPTRPAEISNPPDPTREDFKPARPDPIF